MGLEDEVMAQKTEVTCDRCGQRIVNTKGCYNANYCLRDDSAKITLWGVGEPRSTFGQRIDLCVDCYQKFVSFIEGG